MATHVKNVLWVEQMKTIRATKLHNASDVCNFLQANMGKAHLVYFKVQWQVRQYFHEIRLGDVECIHGYEAHRISGNRSKHTIRSIFHLNKCEPQITK